MHLPVHGLLRFSYCWLEQSNLKTQTVREIHNSCTVILGRTHKEISTAPPLSPQQAKCLYASALQRSSVSFCTRAQFTDASGGAGATTLLLLLLLLLIQFNSILYYLCAESTAARPITDRAQVRYK
jgi:hypothetical protein